MQIPPARPASTNGALTKADSVALWHAVEAFKDCIKALKTMPELAKHVLVEEQRLADARRALRKVQAHVRKPKAVKP